MASHRPKRVQWYHSAIIDWMVANPGRPLYECAAFINRTPTTLSMIINSDMFKAALAARKVEFQTHHDLGIIQKTTRVAHASLDAILTTLEKKKDAVPLDTLCELSDSALSRLGYGAKPSGQQGVQVNVAGNAQVVLPVTQADLEEARMALRQVQESHSRQIPSASPPQIEHDPTGAVPVKSEEVVESAPTDLST